jgi:hypothetical protein
VPVPAGAVGLGDLLVPLQLLASREQRLLEHGDALGQLVLVGEGLERVGAQLRVVQLSARLLELGPQRRRRGFLALVLGECRGRDRARG